MLQSKDLGNTTSIRAAVANSPCATSVDDYHRTLQAYTRDHMATFAIPDEEAHSSIVSEFVTPIATHNSAPESAQQVPRSITTLYSCQTFELFFSSLCSF
jgi:hypothetical protein